MPSGAIDLAGDPARGDEGGKQPGISTFPPQPLELNCVSGVGFVGYDVEVVVCFKLGLRRNLLSRERRWGW